MPTRPVARRGRAVIGWAFALAALGVVGGDMYLLAQATVNEMRLLGVRP